MSLDSVGLDHECGALMSWISALILVRGTLESSLAPFVRGTQNEKTAVYEQ